MVAAAVVPLGPARARFSTSLIRCRSARFSTSKIRVRKAFKSAIVTYESCGDADGGECVVEMLSSRAWAILGMLLANFPPGAGLEDCGDTSSEDPGMATVAV